MDRGTQQAQEGGKPLRESRRRWYEFPLFTPAAFRKPLSPVQVIPLSFLALITIGFVLLMLPFSTAEGRFMHPIDALFTATTSVCVTGLVVRDTGTQLSPFGQAVVFLLLQVGGLGYMVLSTAAALFAGFRLTVQQRLVAQQMLNVFSLRSVAYLLKVAVLFTFIVEALGAVLLALAFLRYPGISGGEALLYGILHSASAFCNAGLDLLGREFRPYCSLSPFLRDPWILLTMATLIILGGLGFGVLADLFLWLRSPREGETFFRGRGRFFTSHHPLSYHSRLVLHTTFWLLGVGTLLLLLLEWRNSSTLGPLSWPQKVVVAFFQAVTPRTAGFSAWDYAQASLPTLMVTQILMFIGASPGGTGGGVKTTTAAVLLAAIVASLRNQPEAMLLKGRISREAVYRALTLVVLSILLVGVALSLLTVTEVHLLHGPQAWPHAFLSLQFEVISAFGTVGLSTGLTPLLSPAGKFILVLVMFIGRIGPITAALAFFKELRPMVREYPTQQVAIG